MSGSHGADAATETVTITKPSFRDSITIKVTVKVSAGDKVRCKVGALVLLHI